jgi:hypothetical protein
MKNSTKYFAFQDTNIGLIQWVGAGEDEFKVAEDFRKDVFGSTATAEEIVEDMEVTEITFEQYKKLEDVGGDDQDAIELLESWK